MSLCKYSIQNFAGVSGLNAERREDNLDERAKQFLSARPLVKTDSLSFVPLEQQCGVGLEHHLRSHVVGADPHRPWPNHQVRDSGEFLTRRTVARGCPHDAIG